LPLQTCRALPLYASSSQQLVLELVTSLALHTIPHLRGLHAPHNAQLNPQATNQLHVFERLGLVLLANFSVNVNGSHVLTRPVLVPVFVWLLVEIHSGLELPKGWGGGARKHWMHHRGGEGGFEPFFESSGGSSVGKYFFNLFFRNSGMLELCCNAKHIDYLSDFRVRVRVEIGMILD
jgi:cholesterol 25-hydroxylase